MARNKHTITLILKLRLILDDTATFKSKGLIAFVPAKFVSCQGLFKNIPLDFSEDEIRDNLEFLGVSSGMTSVLNVCRLNRKIIDKESSQTTYSSSICVLITFEGSTLPERVALCKASSLVNLYVPQVKMCLKCLTYGHISTNCRSDSRCRQCGGVNTHSDQDPFPTANSAPKCVLNSKICKELQFQKYFRSYPAGADPGGCHGVITSLSLSLPRKPRLTFVY